ncbi:MAG TPA: carbohydrate kinase family protein [Gaiellaceae bacterium]|nr:carbohydrate kinase family protein [Gaiellaceae bacterium]
MTSLDVVAVGDVMVDVSIPAEEVAEGHVLGVLWMHAGGSAANAAVWAATAGVRSGVVGRVGDDLPGRALRRELEDRAVHASLALDADLPTGCILAFGERVIAERGANARLAPDDLPPSLGAPAVLVSGYILLHAGSEAAGLAALARASGPWIAVDAASARLLRGYGRDSFLEATERATVLLLNEDEAVALTDAEPEQAARTLADRYRLVCVKRGAAGVTASFEGTVLRAKPPTAERGDGRGAGDAFAGALLAALARGVSAQTALTAACGAGAAAVASGGVWPRLGLAPPSGVTAEAASARPEWLGRGQPDLPAR